MTANVFGLLSLGILLGCLLLVGLVVWFVKSWAEKRKKSLIVRDTVQQIDTSLQLIRNAFEIDVKRIAIDQLLEELRTSDGKALRLSESLMRMAMDFEHQREICADVLSLLSVDIDREERLRRARELLRSELERIQTLLDRDRKEMRA